MKGWLSKEVRIARVLRSPQTALVGSFAGVILIGALFLWLPWSSRPGAVSFVDALFTSTSAVCVTGLTVVDTVTDFTFPGKVIIVILIQIGGLGTMTFAALALQLAGRRMSLMSQALVSDSFFQRDVANEFRGTFIRILTITVIIEGVGTVLLFSAVWSRMDLGDAAFFAVFHSVSAFCNAGFSTWTDNLVAVRDSPLFLSVIMALIVAGGLGYLVLHEIWIAIRDVTQRKGRTGRNRFTLHARVVLRVSALLLVGGTLVLLVFGLTTEEIGWGEKILHASFQSVTARTAGFNSVNIGALPSASLFLLIMLMFIGGSPASCAGGVKTTSLAVWVARIRASLRGEKEVNLMDRRMPSELTNRADLLLGLAVVWNVVGILVLLVAGSSHPFQALEFIFEQVSAFGTVGLSTGVTPKLSVTGKLWLCATMFVGRLGPLTIAMWMFPKEHRRVGYPKGTVMIG